MKEKIFVRKRNPYSSLITLGVAGALFSAPVLAQSPTEEQSSAIDSESETTVTVDEAAPEIVLERDAPKVVAEEGKTRVQVETGEPDVSVQQGEPQVSVNQPEPEVMIEQTEPEVRVNEAEPQVTVNQAEPEVTIESTEPEVEIIDREEEISGMDMQQEGADQEGYAEPTQTEEDAYAQALEEEQQGQMGQSLTQVELSELKNLDVVTANGEELGSVEDIVAAQQGEQAGFVVSVGGFLGIGDTEIFVPASEAELINDQIVWQTSQSTEQLKENYRYRSDQFESVVGRYNTLGEIEGAEVSVISPQ